jgi:UDP-N-acetylglucosamine 1-carboxyvinyltransferase
MPERFLIRGGRPLEGSIAASGSKNAALSAMAAALLTSDPVTLRNVPDIADITEMGDLLTELGVAVEATSSGEVRIQASEFTHTDAPSAQVGSLRASFLVMGPLLARTGEAACPPPGGDVIGVRPLDVHLAGFRALGADVRRDGASWRADAKRLSGARIFLDYPSVMGTVNVLFAATLAEGTTTIVNAATEPEVTMVAEMLRAMGAQISGHGSSIVAVEGVSRLHGTELDVIPDRIETGTYLLAGVATREPADEAHRGRRHGHRRGGGHPRGGARAAQRRAGAGRALPRLPHRPPRADGRRAHAGRGRLAHPRARLRQPHPLRR